jgi:hypothetical protein
MTRFLILSLALYSCLTSSLSAAGRGLWADTKPAPPWQFRKRAREKAARCNRQHFHGAMG